MPAETDTANFAGNPIPVPPTFENLNLGLSTPSHFQAASVWCGG